MKNEPMKVAVSLSCKDTEVFEIFAQALTDIYKVTKEEEVKKIIESALKGAGIEI